MIASPKQLIPLAVLAAGAASAWAIVAHRPVAALQPPHVEPPVVRVVRAEPKAVRPDVQSQGVAGPRDEIDWVAEVAGKVIRVSPHFVTGGFFAAGEELLAIDPRDHDQAIAADQAAIAEARRMVAQEEAQVEQARSEWQALGEGKPSPLTLHEPQLAEARARLGAAEADLAKARLQRSRCELRAPFAGRVLGRQVGLGHYVQPGEKLARLYSTDVAEIRLPISTDKLAYLDLSLNRPAGEIWKGPKVRFTAAVGGVEHHWQGAVVRSEGAIDQATGLLHLVAEVLRPYAGDQAQPLLNGLFVKAQIEGRKLPGLFELPASALNASQDALLVDSDLHLHIRRLEVLRHEGDRLLVKGGLSAGDLVVVEGVEVPVEGMRVRIDAAGTAERIATQE